MNGRVARNLRRLAAEQAGRQIKANPSLVAKEYSVYRSIYQLLKKTYITYIRPRLNRHGDYIPLEE